MALSNDSRYFSNGRVTLVSTTDAKTVNGTTDLTTVTSAVVMGLITSDGVSHNFSKELEKLKAWQNNKDYRTVSTGGSVQVGYTAVELTAAVLEAYFDYVDTDGAYVFSTASSPEPYGIVIDGIDKEQGKTTRIVVLEATNEYGNEIKIGGGATNVPFSFSGTEVEDYGTARLYEIDTPSA